MVIRRNIAFAISAALTLAVTAAAPVAASFEEARPRPLQKDKILRVQDIAANGQTGEGAIVAVGWRQSSNPARLFLSFSTDGGQDYRRGNGNLRNYPVLGDGRRGMSLSICSSRVWVGSSFRNPSDASGDSDVLLTTRTIGGGAAQRFMTKTAASRKVRDVQVACAGKGLIAVSWLEQSGGISKAKLLIRSTESLTTAPTFRKVFKLGKANYNGGIAVAATSDAVHVAWTKGSKKNLRTKRFLISDGGSVSVAPQAAQTVAFKDTRQPQIAARGERVVVAYTDAGKVKTKLSDDVGATFGRADQLLGAGSLSKPSKVHSVDVVESRIVVEASANNKGKLTPKRIESQNLGSTWTTRDFGHKGARFGAFMREKDAQPLLMEAWHNNGSPKDTVRASYEQP
jgi:hypothetical protein